MFEEVFGLPMHPLAVHVPVVLVPLLALVALAYALVPRVRRKVAWAATLLALGAPVAAVVTRLSGDAFGERLYGPQLPAGQPVEAHAVVGDRLMWSTIGLGVATLALVWLRRSTHAGSRVRRWLAWVVTVLLVVLAAVAVFYVVRAGHTGAEMTHGGR